MARRSFIVIDVVEVLEHWYAGRPKTVVAESLGVDRKTVRKYALRAEAAGFVAGGPPVEPEVWQALVAEWFPELVAPELRRESFAECAAFHDAIRAGLATNHLSTVFQRLRDEAGFASSESSLRRYVAVALPDEAKADRVTVRKPDTPPGLEGQVDYGRLGMWFDPVAGRRRALWAFVFVLACSRHLFVWPTLVMDQSAWVAAHVAAAEFFGGLPSRIILDNLRTGVLKPDIYDPKINRAYGEFAHHYGVLLDPARVFKPKDKPKVERMVPFVRDSLFAGRDFPSLAAWRAEAARWSMEVAGARACRALEGAAPAAVFAAVEVEALVALPARPFELAVWSTPKVHDDCHIKVGKTLYSVPWRYIGVTVDARNNGRTVTVFFRGELIKTHVFKANGRQTDWGDYPPDKIAFLQRTPSWYRAQAAAVGPGAEAVIAELLGIDVLHRLRAAQGVLRLADKHGAGRLDAACAKAVAVGDPSYRTVKGILVAGTETLSPAEPVGADTPAMLHGPALIVGSAAGLAS